MTPITYMASYDDLLNMTTKIDNTKKISCLFCGHEKIVPYREFIRLFVGTFTSEDATHQILLNSSQYFYNIYAVEGIRPSYVCEKCLNDVVYDAESMEIKHKLGIL